MNTTINRSFTASPRPTTVGNGAARPICYGDRLFIRVTRMGSPSRVLAELTTTSVSDMTDLYGELRRYTRGKQGLTRLYVRNMTRGWSFEQPFKLYDMHRPADIHRPAPAASVTRPIQLPAASSRHVVPESVRLLFDM